MPADPPKRLLIIDANVLIDYLEADAGILALVARHVGSVYVPLPLLAEVQDLDASECERLGLNVIDVPLEQLLIAHAGVGALSLEDRICLVIARDGGYTCVTNDKALRRACSAANVATLWGLELMAALVERRELALEKARATALAIHAANPHHITVEILRRFDEKLIAIVSRNSGDSR